MDEKMKKEFIQMLKDERGTDTGWAVILSMVGLLEKDGEFERLAELHKGMSEYGGQYMTEKEALKTVEEFVNYDGSRGAKWQPSVLFGAVESLGGKREERGKYNCWALYAVMNMMHSDYGGVLMTVAQGDTYARLCYSLTVARLLDRDRKWNVREYFGLM